MGDRGTNLVIPHDGLPRVAVLLATYNGAEWLEEQILSILSNSNVFVHIFVSDDGSTDSSLAILKRLNRNNITFLPTELQGSAGKNFFRLIREAPWDAFDYVALSDQDDIWAPGKLKRAVTMILESKLDGYSSDATAFWSDGTRRYIKKSYATREFDYLFEGGGPGNTYVLPVASAHQLRSFLKERGLSALNGISMHHDWLIYAFFRSAGGRWLIDPFSGLEYRQHDKNVLGASRGLDGFRSRIQLVASQWYFNQVDTIAILTGVENRAIKFVRAPSLRGLSWVLVHLFQFRRKRSEALMLGLVFVWHYVLHSRK